MEGFRVELEDFTSYTTDGGVTMVVSIDKERGILWGWCFAPRCARRINMRSALPHQRTPPPTKSPKQ